MNENGGSINREELYFKIGKSLGYKNDESAKNEYKKDIYSHVNVISTKSSEEISRIVEDIEKLIKELNKFQKDFFTTKNKFYDDQTTVIKKLINLKNEVNDNDQANKINELILRNLDELLIMTTEMENWASSISNQMIYFEGTKENLTKVIKDNHQIFLEDLKKEVNFLVHMELGFKFGYTIKANISISEKLID